MKAVLSSEIINEMPNSQALGAFNSGVASGVMINDINVSDVFDSIQSISFGTNTISSVGEYKSNTDKQIEQREINRISKYLPENSLAKKIIDSNSSHSIRAGYNFTDKQKWAISYELMKNKEFIRKEMIPYKQQKLAESKKANAKYEASRNKIKENKSNSQVHTSKIKESGAKLGDYYKWLNQSGNPYRKEHFSKKYSAESVSKFLGK